MRDSLEVLEAEHKKPVDLVVHPYDLVVAVEILHQELLHLLQFPVLKDANHRSNCPD